jgi:hypothetical protein
MRYLRIMKEDYITAHCVFMVRKGSPFMASINSVIRRLRDRGVILYWEDMAVRKYMNARDQLAVARSRYDVDNGPTQLLLRHTTVSTFIETTEGEAIKQDLPLPYVLCKLKTSTRFSGDFYRWT